MAAPRVPLSTEPPPVTFGSRRVVRHVAPSAMARLVGRAMFGGGFLLFMWAFPGSPFALYRADVMLGTGNPTMAVKVYDAIASTNPLASVRGEALERAAVALSVELGEPGEARARLEQRLLMRMPDEARATLLDRIGELLVQEGEDLDAARRLREAHDIAPNLRLAPGRLERAARAAAAGGNLELADRLLRRLGQTHPEQFSRSELAVANIALSQGDVQSALVAFQNASSHAFDADVAAVAYLGSATCNERLGNLEQALADLALADLPREVYESRAGQIRARTAIR